LNAEVTLKGMKKQEPLITVNGTILSDAQAMALRCAVEAFAGSLTSDGLGDDEHGRIMVAAYLACLESVRKMMMEGIR
jgi:hypothetical protein